MSGSALAKERAPVSGSALAVKEPSAPGWGAALREIVEFLLPSRCLGCDDRLPLGGSDGPVCAACTSRLREPPWPRCPRCHFPSGTGRVSEHCLACAEWSPALGAARSAVVLEQPAERLVHALKYQGWRELAPVMARRMQETLRPEAAAGGEVLVVPIPTTARRRRQRGYNQAELIADAYAGLAGLTCVDALQRRSGKGSQVSLTPAQRRSNVRGAFAVAPAREGEIEGREVILVDDVLTTGATACEAAEALERGGALGVSLFTFARALPDRRRTPDAS